MTVCAECGGPVDPDVTHVRHCPDCPRVEWGIGWDCDCPEVCSRCCPFCGYLTRTPQETPTMSVTDDLLRDSDRWKRSYDRKETAYATMLTARGVIGSFDSALRDTLATVEQTRRERDAAYAVICQLTDDWDPEEQADPCAHAWTPDEVDAIRRARAAPGAEEDQ